MRIVDCMDIAQLQTAPPNLQDEQLFSPSFLCDVDQSELDIVRTAQTRTSYEEGFISPFLDKEPEAIRQTIEAQFPGSEFNCGFFIILDSISIQEKTCVIADMITEETDPHLMLVRQDFRSALNSIVAITCTSLSFEAMTQDQVQSPSKASGIRGNP